MHDVLRGPAAAGHHDAARSHAKEAPAFHIGYSDVRRALRVAFMLDADDRRLESDARRLIRAIESAEANAIPPYGVDSTRTGDRVGNERFHHESRKAAVAVREHLVA